MKFLTRFRSARYTFLSIFLLVVVTGTVLIYLLPDVYESSAELAIERADEFVFANESADSEALSQRAHLVISNVLRRENILETLREQGVLGADATKEERHESIERFRSNAQIEFDNVSVINQYTGKQGLLSLGLLVSYRDEEPDLAFRVTSALVSDVQQGMRAIAGADATQTEAFLEEELDASSRQLVISESRITEFKNENALTLPELYPVAVRQLDELAAQIERSRKDIVQSRRDRSSNIADLAVTSPEALLISTDGTRIESPVERLEQLRIARAFAISRYSSLHPQVVALDREISALEQHTGDGDTRGLEVELRQVETRLATLRERYSDEHPDVASTRREVTRLSGALDAAAAEMAPRATSKPSNPAYNRMLARRTSLDAEIEREVRGLEQLEERRIALQDQLAQMPAVEQKLTDLERLREREEQTYRELERQITALRLTSNMRDADLLERFVVIEPPIIPLEPAAPRRRLLMALITLLGLCAAAAGALLKIRINDAIWDSGDLGDDVRGRVVLVPRFD